MFGPFSIVALLAAAAVALLMVIWSASLRPFLRERNDARAVQASHVGEPLRLGGVAVIAGIVAAWASGSFPLEPSAAWIFISVLPIIVAGVMEDSGRCVSPRIRFLAALLSAAIMSVATGVWVVRLDITPLDPIMAFGPVGAVITLIFAAGFCHAFNLVDGMNGLAVTIALSSAIGLGLVGVAHGQVWAAAPALLMASALIGFAVFNWPVSRLFLGDAGSYMIGHVLIWSAILLAFTTTDIAIPAMLLILFWPIADTAHSMLRRVIEGRSIMEADRMHLHHKVRRGLEIGLLGRHSRTISNPLTTLLLAPFIITPVAAGVVLSGDPVKAWSVLGAGLAAFAAAHLATLYIAARIRRSGSQDSGLDIGTGAER